MSKLRLALLGQLAFFGAWGAALLAAHARGTVVWLETSPVDPRDFLSGNYVALDFPIAVPPMADCKALIDKGSGAVYVRLAVSTRTARGPQGSVALWDAAACSERVPSASGEVWARAKVRRLWWRSALAYGIERFYVTESSPLRSAQSGRVVAKVSVNGLRNMRVLDLTEQ